MGPVGQAQQEASERLAHEGRPHQGVLALHAEIARERGGRGRGHVARGSRHRGEDRDAPVARIGGQARGQAALLLGKGLGHEGHGLGGGVARPGDLAAPPGMEVDRQGRRGRQARRQARPAVVAPEAPVRHGLEAQAHQQGQPGLVERQPAHGPGHEEEDHLHAAQHALVEDASGRGVHPGHHPEARHEAARGEPLERGLPAPGREPQKGQPQQNEGRGLPPGGVGPLHGVGLLRAHAQVVGVADHGLARGGGEIAVEVHVVGAQVQGALVVLGPGRAEPRRRQHPVGLRPQHHRPGHGQHGQGPGRSPCHERPGQPQGQEDHGRGQPDGRPGEGQGRGQAAGQGPGPEGGPARRAGLVRAEDHPGGQGQAEARLEAVAGHGQGIGAGVELGEHAGRQGGQEAQAQAAADQPPPGRPGQCVEQEVPARQQRPAHEGEALAHDQVEGAVDAGEGPGGAQLEHRGPGVARDGAVGFDLGREGGDGLVPVLVDVAGRGEDVAVGGQEQGRGAGQHGRQAQEVGAGLGGHGRAVPRRAVFEKGRGPGRAPRAPDRATSAP